MVANCFGINYFLHCTTYRCVKYKIHLCQLMLVNTNINLSESDIKEKEE